MALVHWCIAELDIRATDILYSSKENAICKQHRFHYKNKVCDCFSQRVHRPSFKIFKYWIAPDTKKVSKTSLPRTRRNFKLCKVQLPDHKRYYLSGVCVCLSFRKEKIVKWKGFEDILHMAALPFILPFCQLIFISHSNMCCGIFLSPCKLDVLFLEYISFCPAMLFAYSSSDTEGLFSSYYFYWWMTDRILRTLFEGPLMLCISILCRFLLALIQFHTALAAIFPDSFCTFLFTPFAFTLFAITNLTRLWLLFTSGIPCSSTSSFTPLICKPDARNCFHFLSQIYLLCNKKALYHALVTFIAECIHLLSPYR